MLITTQEQADELVAFWANCGYQVAAHAIGDRANRVALNAFQRWLQTHPNRGPVKMRTRAVAKGGWAVRLTFPRAGVEHAQIVNATDFARFAQWDVAASMQPFHAITDMSFAEASVGPERIVGAYAWHTFEQLRVPLFFSSDFPVEAVNPFWGVAACVLREQPSGVPAGGWFPAQRLSLDQCLYGYTNSVADFERLATGSSLSVGSYADFLVLPPRFYDDVAANPRLLWSAAVRETWVGGVRAYAGPR